jgi:hypothetical protein
MTGMTLQPKSIDTLGRNLRPKKKMYLNMPAYLLFTREALASIPLTFVPEAFVMGFTGTHMGRCDVGGELVARRKYLGTRLPVAHMGSRTLVDS